MLYGINKAAEDCGFKPGKLVELEAGPPVVQGTASLDGDLGQRLQIALP